MSDKPPSTFTNDARNWSKWPDLTDAEAGGITRTVTIVNDGGMIIVVPDDHPREGVRLVSELAMVSSPYLLPANHTEHVLTIKVAGQDVEIPPGHRLAVVPL